MSNYEFKIVAIGDSGVGKTCIIYRYLNDSFVSPPTSSIGVDFFTKEVFIDGYPHQIKIWDTAGQERYRAIARSYFRGADGILVVFDISSRESFLSIPNWIEMVGQECSFDVAIFLIGNKCDNDKNREVSTEEAQNFADKNNIHYYFETSAKIGTNISEVFNNIIQQMILQTSSEVVKSVEVNNITEKKGCC